MSPRNTYPKTSRTRVEPAPTLAWEQVSPQPEVARAIRAGQTAIALVACCIRGVSSLASSDATRAERTVRERMQRALEALPKNIRSTVPGMKHRTFGRQTRIADYVKWVQAILGRPEVLDMKLEELDSELEREGGTTANPGPARSMLVLADMRSPMIEAIRQEFREGRVPKEHRKTAIRIVAEEWSLPENRVESIVGLAPAFPGALAFEDDVFLDSRLFELALGALGFAPGIVQKCVREVLQPALASRECNGYENPEYNLRRWGCYSGTPAEREGPALAKGKPGRRRTRPTNEPTEAPR